MNKASNIAESSDVKHKTKPNVFYNQESLKSNFRFLPPPGNTKSNNLSQNFHKKFTERAKDIMWLEFQNLHMPYSH